MCDDPSILVKKCEGSHMSSVSYLWSSCFIFCQNQTFFRPVVQRRLPTRTPTVWRRSCPLPCRNRRTKEPDLCPTSNVKWSNRNPTLDSNDNYQGGIRTQTKEVRVCGPLRGRGLSPTKDLSLKTRRTWTRRFLSGENPSQSKRCLQRIETSLKREDSLVSLFKENNKKRRIFGW